MTNGQKRRQDFDERTEKKTLIELDSVYAHLRALVEGEPGDYRHAIVGLLPECQPAPVEIREKLPDLADLHDEQVKQAWARYGYAEGPK
jgi:hypothetical protein